MTFLAQLCFVESRDCFEFDLPGDVLLIFLPPDGMEEGFDDDEIYCKWMHLTTHPLIDPVDIPPQPSLTCCCGIRHRTVEFISNRDCDWQYWRVESTKIGGAPSWIQGHDDDVRSGMKYIGAIGCINQLEDMPLIDRSKHQLAQPERDGLWTYVDSGQIHVFLTPEGRTVGWSESY